MVLFHLKFLLSLLSWEPKNQWDLRDLSGASKVLKKDWGTHWVEQGGF